MELHQLDYVVKLATHLHFSKAAGYLGITQPSLSQQIDKLEKELGVKLFERKTRSVKLTPAGEVFILHACKVLADLDQLGEAMRTISPMKIERLRIGTFVPNLGVHKVATLIQQFQGAFPNISIHLTEKAGSRELYKLLTGGGLDGAFLVPSLELGGDQTMVCHTLIPGAVNIICRKDHPFAARTTVPLQELAKTNCIAMTPTYSIYGSVIDACRANGIKLNIISHCNQIETMVDLVLQGFGFSFLSSQFAENISHSNIVIRPLAPMIERNLSFVYVVNQGYPPALLTFRDFILKTFDSTSCCST